MHEVDCVVIGGGLAGLACCRELVRRGKTTILVEASSRIGGRVATDTVEGFRIDRGFQVYLDAYPEGKRQLDLSALRLGGFEPGAILADGRRLLTNADPWRRPVAPIRSILQGAVGPGDAIRMARLRSDVLRALRKGRLDPIVQGSDRSTREELRERGFSDEFVRRFFEPFFGGVFLERDLATSAEIFRVTFAMFAIGRACLPRGGMEAIPRQLAEVLPQDALRLGVAAVAVEPGRVELADGSTLRARNVVVATPRAAAAAVLPESLRSGWAERRDKSTMLVAFAAPRSPLPRATILVTASGVGPIDNLTVPSDVVEGYAPAGSHLVCVSVRHEVTSGFGADERGGVVGRGIGRPSDAAGPSERAGDLWSAPSDEALCESIRGQAAGWFGSETDRWRHLATIRVGAALPDESPEGRRLRPSSSRLAPGLFMCGDHCATASINGALASGRICAREVAGEAGAG
ncbi:MAG: NAD(P)/FAD-dependent oxidoreductase [Planctomycetaceae bacterium]